MRRRRIRQGVAAHRDPGNDRWLLSYADFVTLLLAVFIVLFAFAREQKKSIKMVSAGIHSGFEELGIDIPPRDREAHQELNKLQPNPRPQPGKSGTLVPAPFDAAQLKAQIENVLGDEIGKQEIVVQQTSEGLTISLQDFGFFNSGQAQLLPGAAAQLKKTARVLMQHNLEVRVEGHSDNQPIHTSLFTSNWQLSTARATSVLSLLLDEAGFPPNKISVAGYGPYRPVSENITPEGRRKNRRVDLVIIEPKSPVSSLP